MVRKIVLSLSAISLAVALGAGNCDGEKLESCDKAKNKGREFCEKKENFKDNAECSYKFEDADALKADKADSKGECLKADDAKKVCTDVKFANGDDKAAKTKKCTDAVAVFKNMKCQLNQAEDACEVPAK